MAEGNWTLFRSQTDESVLVVVRRRDDGRLDMRRLSYDSFDLALEDAVSVYEPIPPDTALSKEVSDG